MNVETGELFRISPETEKFFEGELMKKNSPIKEVPDEFFKEVDRLLAGRESVFVDMERPSPLVDWAKRNQPNPNGNRKHRRKMAKEDRRNKR